jgi:hypothetical protein
MPKVRLLHPVVVFLRKADRENTALMDDALHEPVGQVRRAQKPIKLRAQIKDGKTEDARPSFGGVVMESDGYLLFLLKDLNRDHIMIEIGDRVVQIGEGANARETDLYVVKLQHLGHYPGSGPNLLKAFFEDRHPSRQRGDR